MEPKETLAMVQGQAEIWQHMFSFVDSMALKCAVELRIADIIHCYGSAITLRQIASGINSPSPNISHLARIMRSLVRKNIFTEHHHPVDGGGETLYGLTQTSKWLLHDAELSLVPMMILQNHSWLLTPWHCLGQSIKEGGTAFNKVHGDEVWDFASKNPDFNNIFNDAMACTAKNVMRVILAGYEDGFGCMGSLADVGGGTGGMIAEIVKAHPHIKGINFDLPHVIATAPLHEGVTHVGGDMFDAIPNADAIFMKWVLHDWSDEHCINILKNCRKAIQQKSGKVIIVDIVVEKDGNDLFDEIRMAFDLLMMVHTIGGKERTELEWKKLLEEVGFARYKIIKIPTIPSIIVAYPYNCCCEDVVGATHGLLDA
ncbi:desmethylxanthohumol 6'-O-methyltransferase-like [Corylus avellana]|uniref:desmethylxanthohumol 6'-O-methyltransferase-like n=1 Tax=Corylus avellana TaxID=13451 RepID=UPI001E23C812|nr:desmethylxanthohumol 6'-O-methyltransferase-like [Corylus avellana]